MKSSKAIAKPPVGSILVDHVVANMNSKKEKNILNSMFVEFPEGQVTAILGPSGSGKTTLLDFITGSISGGAVATGMVNLPGKPAYVPQGDHLHGFYTCETYLSHYARLAGLDPNSEEVKSHIRDLLQSLGLTLQQTTRVGDIFLRGLSGGQKRRLSVALEALTSPSILFLDEPTSGLDSNSAMHLMKFLKQYCLDVPGRRVILTIHQPSSLLWDQIDHIVLLSQGKLMYQGPRVDMERFFESHGAPTPPDYNPIDHYVDLVNADFVAMEKDGGDGKVTPDQWASFFSEWHSSSNNNSNSTSKDTKQFNENETNETINRGNCFTAIVELTRRYFKNLFLNPGILGTRLAMYIMLSILIGALFWDLGSLTTFTSIQSRVALLFYCVAFFIFMSVAVLPFTVMERDIVEKEVRNGYYHPLAYQTAQAIASIPGAALLALVTTLIITSMTGLREPMFYFLNMFLSLVCAEALAQLVSHIVPHFIIGIGLVAGLYGLFMLLQGFMLVPSEFPNWLSWSYHCAFHTYSWRSFMVSEFRDEVYPDAEMQGLGSGNDILELYEIDDVNRSNDMVSLVVYALIIHLFSFVVLQLRYMSSRKENAMKIKGE